MTELHEKIGVWLKKETIQILEEIRKQQGFATREDALTWLIHEWKQQQPQMIRPQLGGAEPAVADCEVIGENATGQMNNPSPPHQDATQQKLETSITKMVALNNSELVQKAASVSAEGLIQSMEGIVKMNNDITKSIKALAAILVGTSPPVPSVPSAPIVNDLLKTHSEFQEFLRFKRQQETEAIHKLSRMQQDILVKLFSETDGHGEVRWTPKEWFGASEPGDRAAFSTSLRRLESRGLVERQSVEKSESPKRTAVIKLTDLGHRIAKRLTKKLTSET